MRSRPAREIGEWQVVSLRNQLIPHDQLIPHCAQSSSLCTIFTPKTFIPTILHPSKSQKCEKTMRKLLKSLLNGQGHHLFRPPSIPPHLGFLRMPYASSFSLPSVSSMEFEISIIDRACNLVQNYQWISLKTEFPSMNPSMAAFILSKLSSNHYLVLQFFLWVSDQPGFKHSVETYCTTLLVLSNGGLRSGIFVLIQRLIFNHSKSFLIEAVDFLVNHSVKPMFLDTIIVSLVRVQMFEEVVLVVGVINRHGYILPFQYCNRLVRFLKMNKGILDLNHVIFSSFTRCTKNLGSINGINNWVVIL
ncbi:uncharacterized protein LOC110006390 [Amborella trichopoda]|uniref:uncharacterized protein LOC110006390 n=1 Tax=Amborella trichopoda TaxID=13333 RepID=UPI0009BDF6E5|nr:uncharacterized protein LOC110006390 [Amborella trichopoda]XP_020517347.1 uncharacterized protein LOC110006390 [Amborella trichopoda]XP_020517348.1 uncharacterized protein LOC110006390 [Amborella trichopoda]|eukprot:XP_020517346.1 uncharacterized protein LOC110006390 [Amborella trichopoda]